MKKRKKKAKAPKASKASKSSQPKALVKSCLDDLWPGALTHQETNVAVGICLGETSQSISDDLGIASSTLRTHVRNLLVKTGCASRLQLVAMIFKHSFRKHR